jgi:outer membrane protein assembly factor BamB
MTISARCLILCCLVLPASQIFAENWPGWRGPRGDGTSLEHNLPTGWNGREGTHIAWKTPIPGVGHASPIVWDDRIFLVSCREDHEDRILLCLDRDTGRTVWEQTVAHSPLEMKHRLNSHASSTPATDGTHVYVSFAVIDPTVGAGDKSYTNDKKAGSPCELLVAAYDFTGRPRWEARPGKFASCHGFCSPPIVFENLLIVNGDHDGNAWLAALDRATGKTVWKIPRENKLRSYCPPIIRDLAGRTQMVLSGSKCVASYDPRTGKRHWIIDGPTEQYVASLVDNGKLLFLTAGFPEFHIMGIRPDGEGNVTKTHVAWHTTKGCAYVPSPIVAGNGKCFVVVSDNGLASCFEAATGERYWMERIGPHYSASLVAADGLVHFLSDDGVTKIVRPGPKFELVAENQLGEQCRASPAISQGRIYLRGEKHLFAVGK